MKNNVVSVKTRNTQLVGTEYNFTISTCSFNVGINKSDQVQERPLYNANNVENK